MDDKRTMLRHFLASLAYRTQKALRDAPSDFGSFCAQPETRTPHEIVCHMDSVLGYARTFLIGGTYRAPSFDEFGDAILHFHQVVEDLARLIEEGADFGDISAEALLQGPFSDAMSHAGQLAILRRLFGSPVPPENFVFADINPSNLGPDQPPPVSPDEDWPEKP